jgi:hypothetical protein
MAKRMQLKLDDKTHALIMELAELSGMSASALVTAMFQMSHYELEQALKNLRIIKNRPAKVFEELVNVMERKHFRRITTTPRRGKGSLRDEEPQADLDPT